MNAEAPAATATSSVRLTPQQRSALDRGAASVALSAGAGCGKTTVLAERFLRELEGPEGRALRSVVALTFTEKAALEIRGRIRARCREKIASGSVEEARHWRTILRGLEAAPIGTFHEFCGRMLRLHAIDAGIDPEFAVLDDSISRTLRDQAVRITLRAALSQQNLDLIELAVDYGLGQIQSTLVDLVASATLDDLEAWVGQDAETILALWREVWAREGRPALVRQAAHAARRCHEALEPLDAASPKLQARRGEILAILPGLISGNAEDPDLAELRQLARIADLKGKDVWPAEEVKELVQKRFESLRKAIDKIAPRLTWNEALTDEEIGNRQRLARLSLNAAREYERLKRERVGLDFDDLQLRFVELLRNRPEILSEPSADDETGRSVFEFILVDEFQDTDRLQSEILRRLGGPDFHTGRLFVVGDFKQSIYGFRGAEPAIFQEWRREFPPAGRRDLSENFRSVPGIIHFVNALFAECFETGEDGPGSEGSAPPINRLGSIRDPSDREPAVEFLWADAEGARDGQTDGSDPKPKPKPRRATAHELRKAEAGALARHLRVRLDQGWTIYDRREKRLRPAGPGDVAFLFRAMTDVGPYESALAEEGFDYLTIGGAAFFVQQEIHDIINVLSVVEDPLDEVALAGALRSPFFSLTDDGLYWLATALPGGLTMGLARVEEIANLPPEDCRQASRARALLDGWRELKDRVPIAELVNRIVDESGYEAAIVCEFLGPRRLANTRKLATMARDFDRQGGFLLADFVAQLRAHRDDPPREEQASTSDEEGASIRLMSIHQSKGLEFPIVVVPDLNRSNEPRNRLAAIHPELGLVVRPPLAEPGDDDIESPEESAGGSLGWETFRALSRDQDEQEAIRLFYVAATRARDGLILSSGYATGQDPRSTALRLLDERFTLNSGLCRATLPDDWPRPEVRVVPAGRIEDEPDLERQISLGTTAPRRQSLDDIRESIVGLLARADGSMPGAASSRLASLVDLDQPHGLSSRSRRVDRLIRSIVADLRLFQGVRFSRIAERASARQFPAAHGSLIREANRLLAPWFEAESFRRLRGLPAEGFREGFTWSVRHATNGGDPVVFRGSCDLFVRDPEAGWMPLVVCLGGPSHGSAGNRAACRLRLQLAGEAADANGLGPMRAGWILELGGPDGPELRRVDDFDRQALDEALASFFSAIDTTDD